MKQAFGVAVGGWFCRGEGEAMGGGRFFLTCDPLHKECDRNPEPCENRREKKKKSVKVREAEETV